MDYYFKSIHINRISYILNALKHKFYLHLLFSGNYFFPKRLPWIQYTKQRIEQIAVQSKYPSGFFSGEQAFRSKLNQKKHLSAGSFKHSTEIMLSHLASKSTFFSNVYLIISSQCLIWENFIFSVTHQLFNDSTTMIFMGVVHGI